MIILSTTCIIIGIIKQQTLPQCNLPVPWSFAFIYSNCIVKLTVDKCGIASTGREDSEHKSHHTEHPEVNRETGDHSRYTHTYTGDQEKFASTKSKIRTNNSKLGISNVRKKTIRYSMKPGITREDWFLLANKLSQRMECMVLYDDNDKTQRLLDVRSIYCYMDCMGSVYSMKK